MPLNLCSTCSVKHESDHCPMRPHDQQPTRSGFVARGGYRGGYANRGAFGGQSYGRGTYSNRGAVGRRSHGQGSFGERGQDSRRGRGGRGASNTLQSSQGFDSFGSFGPFRGIIGTATTRLSHESYARDIEAVAISRFTRFNVGGGFRTIAELIRYDNAQQSPHLTWFPHPFSQWPEFDQWDMLIRIGNYPTPAPVNSTAQSAQYSTPPLAGVSLPAAQIVHEPQALVACPICSEIFFTNSALQSHFGAAHRAMLDHLKPSY